MARTTKPVKAGNSPWQRKKRRSRSENKLATPGGQQFATLVLLNKPYGIVSQFSGDDRTLAEIITQPGLYPAGRLDKDSEGLLLLTDNGKLQHRISHPTHKLKKYYWAQVEGEINPSALKQLCTGVRLKDGPATALSAKAINPPEILWPRVPAIRARKTIVTSWIELCIDEGRNRQVRRMTAAVGLPTLRLIRHRIGDWSLEYLPSGNYQTIELKISEISSIGS